MKPWIAWPGGAALLVVLFGFHVDTAGAQVPGADESLAVERIAARAIRSLFPPGSLGFTNFREDNRARPSSEPRRSPDAVAILLEELGARLVESPELPLACGAATATVDCISFLVRIDSSVIDADSAVVEVSTYTLSLPSRWDRVVVLRRRGEGWVAEAVRVVRHATLAPRPPDRLR